MPGRTARSSLEAWERRRIRQTETYLQWAGPSCGGSPTPVWALSLDPCCPILPRAPSGPALGYGTDTAGQEPQCGQDTWALSQLQESRGGSAGVEQGGTSGDTRALPHSGSLSPCAPQAPGPPPGRSQRARPRQPEDPSPSGARSPGLSTGSAGGRMPRGTVAPVGRG